MTTRRWSRDWALRPEPSEPEVEVLIPSAGTRPAELAVTLAGLAAQDGPAFDVIISEQSDDGGIFEEPAVRGMIRVLRAQGRRVSPFRHRPRLGIAEQRHFLFTASSAPLVLYLDDDVWLETGALERMVDAIRTLGCGFIGMCPQGLTALPDRRPDDLRSYEPWDGRVEPEVVRPGTPAYERKSLHVAANLAHLSTDLEIEDGRWMPYRIAWSGACALYRRDALDEVGGFSFWDRLPTAHSGEDVAVQWQIMEKRGAAGILPSGAVHLEPPTTLPDREVEVPDVLFADMMHRHGGR